MSVPQIRFGCTRCGRLFDADPDAALVVDVAESYYDSTIKKWVKGEKYERGVILCKGCRQYIKHE